MPEDRSNARQSPATPVVLSIAGFDPSSGAGITADVKTIAAHGCYATTCITALTVQTTQGVRAVEAVKPEIVRATLRELAADLPPKAVRIGMLGSAEVVEAVAEFLQSTRPANVVLDPVVRSSSGAELLESAGVDILIHRMLPLTAVVTPNVDEVSLLAGGRTANRKMETDAVSRLIDEAEPKLRTAILAGEALLEYGPKAVVITGGHLDRPTDVLLWRTGEALQAQAFPSSRIESRSTHGTGCAFAASLACSLALGRPLPEAVARAQQYVFRAIEKAEPLGHGVGPIAHLWPLRERQ